MLTRSEKHLKANNLIKNIRDRVTILEYSPISFQAILEKLKLNGLWRYTFGDMDITQTFEQFCKHELNITHKFQKHLAHNLESFFYLR